MKNKFLIFLFLCFSCASKNGNQLPYAVVDIEKKQPSVGNVSITEKEQTEETNEVEEEDKEDPYTIIFGPGLYLTGSYLPIIRKLENEPERIHSLTGHGMGAYFATMFAFGFKSDFIEWNYYTFLEKVKDFRPFSDKWKSAYKDVLLDDLKNKNFLDSRIKLLLPIYSTSSKKVTWVEKGNVVDALLANIEFASTRSLNSAAFPWEFFSPYYFRNVGASRFVAILSIFERPKFKRPDGFLNGLYTKAVSNYMRIEDSFSKVYKLPVMNYKIDAPLKSISENRGLIDFVDELVAQLFIEDEEEQEEEVDE